MEKYSYICCTSDGYCKVASACDVDAPHLVLPGQDPGQMSSILQVACGARQDHQVWNSKCHLETIQNIMLAFQKCEQAVGGSGCQAVS